MLPMPEHGFPEAFMLPMSALSLLSFYDTNVRAWFSRSFYATDAKTCFFEAFMVLMPEHGFSKAITDARAWFSQSFYGTNVRAWF